MELLSPCPFCGNPNVAIVSDKEMEHTDDCDCYAARGDSWAVNCSAAGTESKPGKGCGATGGYSEDQEEAVEKWNRRAHSATLNVTGESK